MSSIDMTSMRYTVKFITSSGETLVKDVVGQSLEEVRNKILVDGCLLVDIRCNKTNLSSRPLLRSTSLIIFNQELLALLKAGIPLLQSLEMLSNHCKDAILRRSLGRVVNLLREGVSFSEALDQVGTFPKVYMANVVAGERSGSLPGVIARWLTFQNFAQSNRRRIIESLVYPAFLAVVMILAMVVIVNGVLPTFAALYADSNIPMPIATSALLYMGEFFRSTIYLQIFLAVGLVFFMRWFFATAAGKLVLDRFILAIPKVGTLYHMYHSSVFARTLSILLSGGLPVVQALDVIQRTTPSASMQSRLIRVAGLVRAGSSLYLALEDTKLLHPLAVEMVRVGEQASALSDMLNYVADFFDQEVEKATTIVTTLVGPIMLLIMGVMVMGLLLAVYAPLFQASSMVK